jgi:hypothetical protein
MPFDPKLIHPDEPPLSRAGELDLPDDLGALAEQLADDARHLASCYPADAAFRSGSFCLQAEGVSPLWKSPRASSRRSLAAIVLASSVTLASVASIGLAIAFALSVFQDNTSRPAPNSLVQSPTTANAPVAANIEPIAAPAVASPGPSPTTLSLGELSGPELEALLDLWPGKGQKPPFSISF